MDDELLFKAILNNSKEIVYSGKTRLDGYSEKYSVKGRTVQENIEESGPVEMDLGNGKAEYQKANNYRGVLRTTESIGKLLENDKDDYIK